MPTKRPFAWPLRHHFWTTVWAYAGGVIVECGLAEEAARYSCRRRCIVQAPAVLDDRGGM
jgi:hypothetical protein